MCLPGSIDVRFHLRTTGQSHPVAFVDQPTFDVCLEGAIDPALEGPAAMEVLSGGRA